MLVNKGKSGFPLDLGCGRGVWPTSFTMLGQHGNFLCQLDVQNSALLTLGLEFVNQLTFGPFFRKMLWETSWGEIGMLCPRA